MPRSPFHLRNAPLGSTALRPSGFSQKQPSQRPRRDTRLHLGRREAHVQITWIQKEKMDLWCSTSSPLGAVLPGAMHRCDRSAVMAHFLCLPPLRRHSPGPQPDDRSKLSVLGRPCVDAEMYGATQHNQRPHRFQLRGSRQNHDVWSIRSRASYAHTTMVAMVPSGKGRKVEEGE